MNFYDKLLAAKEVNIGVWYGANRTLLMYVRVNPSDIVYEFRNVKSYRADQAEQYFCLDEYSSGDTIFCTPYRDM